MVNNVGGNPGEGEKVVQDSLKGTGEGTGRLGGVDVDGVVAGAGEGVEKAVDLLVTGGESKKDGELLYGNHIKIQIGYF